MKRLSSEEIRIAVAELCGFKPNGAGYWHKDKIVYALKYEAEDHDCVGIGGGETFELPYYPEDLNACHEMEKTLTEDEGGEYEELLEDIAQRDLVRECSEHWLRFKVCHAKATQRCEAFLRIKRPELFQEPPTLASPSATTPS